MHRRHQQQRLPHVHCKVKASHTSFINIHVYSKLLQSSKTSFYVISPSSFFCVYDIPFCYSNSPSIIFAHVNYFLLIVVNMSSNLVCYLIHDIIFLSINFMPNIISPSPMLSDPSVKIG